MSDEKIIGPNPCHICGGEYGQHNAPCAPPVDDVQKRIVARDLADAIVEIPGAYVALGDGGMKVVALRDTIADMILPLLTRIEELEKDNARLQESFIRQNNEIVELKAKLAEAEKDK